MARTSTAELFAEVQEAFTIRNLLGRPIRLSVEGASFRVRCDQLSFTVYRINEQHHIPPGLPGWTVCRLSDGECLSQGGEAEEAPVDQLALVQRWVSTVLGALTAGDYQ